MYAEDPDNNFFPSPGKILERRVPTGPGIRLDDGIYAGWTVPNEYDPMLGKLIAWGKDRDEAIARLKRALSEYYASGIKTNVSLFNKILASDDFQSGAIYTRWLDDFLQRRADGAEPQQTQTGSGDGAEDAAAIAAALWHLSHRDPSRKATASSSREGTMSRWRAEALRDQVNREPQR
jgi:acetyl-CoA carboxylase biotin carboxylase subunit